MFSFSGRSWGRGKTFRSFWQWTNRSRPFLLSFLRLDSDLIRHRHERFSNLVILLPLVSFSRDRDHSNGSALIYTVRIFTCNHSSTRSFGWSIDRARRGYLLLKNIPSLILRGDGLFEGKSALLIFIDILFDFGWRLSGRFRFVSNRVLADSKRVWEPWQLRRLTLSRSQ